MNLASNINKLHREAIPLAIRRHKHVATVREALHDRHVVVGVSGGADSTALLILCCATALQKSASIQVTAAHINHGLRKAADDEQRLVESLCARLGVRCVATKINVLPINGSLAAGARESRYHALSEIAQLCNATVVAVAHHAGDQLETMLMALCRGAGLHKLAGMKQERQLDKDLMLVRPLLHVEKSELERICKGCGVNWCNDPTNVDPTSPRGRLRQHVIPILRELWQSADRHAANAADVIQAAADAFGTLIPEGTQWNRKSLSRHPTPIIAAAVHHAVGEHATFETINAIAHAIADDNTDPRTFVCEHGCVATVTANHVKIIYT